MADSTSVQMATVGDLLTRDLTHKIEEIIQVDQADEQSVYAEITEYIATDSIREQYHDLLKAVAEAPSDPHESVGVWCRVSSGPAKVRLPRTSATHWKTGRFSAKNSLISSSNNWAIPVPATCSTSLTPRRQPRSSSLKWRRRPTHGRSRNELPS